MSKSRDLGEFPAAALYIDASGAITTTGPIDGRDVSTDGTKLDTIESSADVTDTANVTASGALMDLELASIASVKALNQGVATTDDPTFTNTHLAAIDVTIAVTAVDTFVYDTRKDSDGGAWRKRTQHASWYNETLNTATRGSRKEFPVVAVIVADTNDVTIYDGDDPAMPMWMVFSGGGVLSWATSGPAPIAAAKMLNGMLVVGGGQSGCLMSFLEDDVQLMNSSNYSLTSSRLIRGRNGATGFVGSGGYVILSYLINDVAMTVLPNAPIDPATGLPVPTIAVATNSGVSVIKDDGTVVDITQFTYAIEDISFDKDGYIWSNGDYRCWLVRLPIPAVDSQEQNIRTLYKGTVGSDPAINGGSSNSSNRITAIDALKNKTAVSTLNKGFTLIGETLLPLANQSVAYITSDYNTGWMNGDIKLATLSDTDATDVVGTELVTNGDFSNGITNWVPYSSGTDYSVVGGQLVTVADDAMQAFPVVAGKTYTISADVSAGTGINIYGNASAAGTQIAYVRTSSEMSTFVAPTSDITVYVYPNSTVDNISVRLAEPDRSVNGNGLQVFGTVTKTPVATGADLVGYSGFSSSSYLQQPYNADLDFGTGDFSIMGWINVGSSVSAYASILSRVLSNNSETNAWSLRINSSDNNYYLYTNNTSVFTSPLTRSTWQFLTVARRSGVVYFYVNGAFRTTGPMANTITNVGASVVVGYESTHHIGNSSAALFRISATAPTAEQIAKIYNDEKPLFQENAQATLYGTSNAVTALAYDDDTELLHAGTSSGRSVFQGLRRVSNTTDAVTTSISASNSIIVEE